MNGPLCALLLILALPLDVLAHSGTASLSTGVYPVPASEMNERVTDWLHGEHVLYSHRMADNGEFILECVRERERFLIRIRPYSPLASQAEISGIDAGSPLVAALHKSLSEYVRVLHGEGPAVSLPVPLSVRRMEKNLVCLSARVGEGMVEFSGFAIDRTGLVVTTAHDLDSVRDVVVRLDNGEEIAGEVVKRDALRDLSLIRLSRSLSGAVPVSKGRRKLNPGEKIFAAVCPIHSQERFRTGIVDEPPARVNGQPLWQVNMGVAPGDSGGPVFDPDGRLVGVVKGRFRGVWSRGFLIPVTTLREFLGMGGK